VRTIAKRFVFGLTAAAQADGGASGKPKSVTLGIDDFEVAFDSDRSVIVDDYFRRGHCVSGPRAAA